VHGSDQVFGHLVVVDGLTADNHVLPFQDHGSLPLKEAPRMLAVTGQPGSAHEYYRTVQEAVDSVPRRRAADRRRTDGSGHRRITGAGGRDRAQPGPGHRVVLMLTTPKARVNGPAFVLG
jgi:hypothetical protein